MNRTAAPDDLLSDELIAHCIRLFALPPALTATSTLSSSSSSSSYYSISRLRIASRVSRTWRRITAPLLYGAISVICAPPETTPQPNLGPSGHRGFLVIRKTNGSFESTQWIAPPPPSGPWTHVKRLELVSAAPADTVACCEILADPSRTRGSPGGSAINTLSLAGCTMDLASVSAVAKIASTIQHLFLRGVCFDSERTAMEFTSLFKSLKTFHIHGVDSYDRHFHHVPQDFIPAIIRLNNGIQSLQPARDDIRMSSVLETISGSEHKELTDIFMVDGFNEADMDRLLEKHASSLRSITANFQSQPFSKVKTFFESAVTLEEVTLLGFSFNFPEFHTSVSATVGACLCRLNLSMLANERDAIPLVTHSQKTLEVLTLPKFANKLHPAILSCSRLKLLHAINLALTDADASHIITSLPSLVVLDTGTPCTKTTLNLFVNGLSRLEMLSVRSDLKPDAFRVDDLVNAVRAGARRRLRWIQVRQSTGYRWVTDIDVAGLERSAEVGGRVGSGVPDEYRVDGWFGV